MMKFHPKVSVLFPTSPWYSETTTDVSVFLIEPIICNRIITNGNNMSLYKYEIFFKELDKVYFTFFVHLALPYCRRIRKLR